MGIWVANNLKFYDEQRNISGEIDCLVRDKETEETCIIEIKTFWNYQAKARLIGNRNHSPAPIRKHLMQVMIYLDQLSNISNEAIILYFARDSGDRTQFRVKLVKEGNSTYPEVDGTIDRSHSLEDIYSRFHELQSAHITNLVPDRDFELEYSPEKIERLAAEKVISKTAYEKWKTNGERIGDSECSWCQFRDHCWQLGSEDVVIFE